MSVYLSEWFDGPNQFLDLADIAWDPHIICKEDETHNSVSVYVSLFNSETIHSYIDSFEEKTKNTFLIRLDAATKFILTSMGAKKLISESLSEIYMSSGRDVELTSEVFSELFIALIMEFEFWLSLDVTEVIANLIFYGTVHDPKPFVFIIPPKSEWGLYKNSWRPVE